MAFTADEMIAALNGYEPDLAGYDENQFDLYPIMEGFKELPDRDRVVPAIFALMEAFQMHIWVHPAHWCIRSNRLVWNGTSCNSSNQCGGNRLN